MIALLMAQNENSSSLANADVSNRIKKDAQLLLADVHAKDVWAIVLFYNIMEIKG